ncbi:hypothetical protein ACIQCR_31620 [Streptomyces sp. NPDC093249]
MLEGAVSTSDKPREVARFTRRFEAMVGLSKDFDRTTEFLNELAKG